MANTLSSDLVPDTASERAITVLQNRLVALGVFSKDYSQELVDPTRPVAIPVATGAGSAQENPTNFEQGDTTVGSTKVTPVHISKSFHITQAELNSGHKLENLFDINLHVVADKILDKAFTPITVANYGAAEVVAATAADFDAADMRKLLGALKKAGSKNLVLEGSYYAEQMPSNNDGFKLGDGAYGFDKFRQSTRFDGAGAGVVGFACHPQAMGTVARVPAVASAVAANMETMELIELPDLGITIQFCTWASMQSRTMWASFDLCFGAAVGDPGALKIIATA